MLEGAEAPARHSSESTLTSEEAQNLSPEEGRGESFEASKFSIYHPKFLKSSPKSLTRGNPK